MISNLIPIDYGSLSPHALSPRVQPFDSNNNNNNNSDEMKESRIQATLDINNNAHFNGQQQRAQLSIQNNVNRLKNSRTDHLYRTVNSFCGVAGGGNGNSNSGDTPTITPTIKPSLSFSKPTPKSPVPSPSPTTNKPLPTSSSSSKSPSLPLPSSRLRGSRSKMMTDHSHHNAASDDQHQLNELDLSQPTEYFDQLFAIIKQVIIEIKTLYAIPTNDTDQVDRILKDAAYALVKNISNLITMLEQFPFPYQHIDQYHSHLLVSVKSLSSLVLELIASSRAMILNPFDFLTSNNFKASKEQSIECIKATVMALENFKLIYFQFEEQLQQQQQEDEENVVQFQGEHEHDNTTPTGSTTPVRMSSDSSSSEARRRQFPAITPPARTNSNDSLSRSASGMPVSPRTLDEQSEELIRVEKCAVNLILNVNRITEASIEGNFQDLVTAAKGISNEVILIAKEVRIKGLGVKLKESAVNVINMSKLVLKNKNDQYYVDNLEVAVGKLNEEIKKIIYAIKHTSIQAAANLSQSLATIDANSLDAANNASNASHNKAGHDDGSDVAPPIIRERSLKTIGDEQMVEFEQARQERESRAMEKEQLAMRLEQERIEQEKYEQEEKEREERERLEQERLEQERMERERVEENERLKKLLVEKERIQKETSDQQKSKLKHAEQDKLDNERLEKEVVRMQHDKPVDKNDKVIKERHDRMEREKLDKLYTTAAVGASSAPNSAPHTPLSTSPTGQSQPSTPTIHGESLKPPGKDRDSTLDADKSRGGKDKDKDKEGNKTIGKFLSKLVHKGGSKKRQPIPFDASPTSPGSSNGSPASTPPLDGPTKSSPLATSASLSTLENNPDVASSPMKLFQSVPLSPHNFEMIKEEAPATPERPLTSVSVSIPQVSLSPRTPEQQSVAPEAAHMGSSPNSVLPIAESPSRIYLRKKTERTLNIGNVANGKHSPSPIKKVARSSLHPSFDHSSTTNLIVNLMLNQFEGFSKEWEAMSSDDLAKTTEKINYIIKQHVEECMVSGGGLGGAGGISRSSHNFANQLSSIRQLTTNAAQQNNDNQYQTLSLRYKMTRKLSTIKKKNDPSKPSILPPADSDASRAARNIEEIGENLVNTTSRFVDDTIDLVSQAYEFSIHNGHNDTVALTEPVDNVYSLLSNLLDQAMAVSRIDDNSFLSKNHVKNTKKIIASSQGRGPGKIDATIVSCPPTYRQFVERSLETSIISQCNAVRAIAIQMTTIIIGVSSKPWDNNIQLQLFATTNTFCDCLAKLLDNVANKIYIKSMKLQTSGGADDLDLDDQLGSNDEEEDVNIWLEANSSSNLKSEWISDDGSKTGRLVPKAGTLNKLIESLTSEKPYDNSKYTRTFLMTYLSFTTTHKLFDKLVQRYTVPEEKDHSFRVKVQVRVASFLKSWVERNFGDLDNKLIEKLRAFANERLLTDEHGDLARLLLSTIDQRLAAEEERARQLATPSFRELMIPEGQKSPSTLFLLMNDSEIARQLTLIEGGIFGRINPTELQQQVWSKDATKHRAPNIMELINRANKFSFWVASQILWQEDIGDRVSVYEKFLNIAKHLRDMNNFNTLMNIYAGLNQSSIMRLKKTFAQLSPAAVAIYNMLEKLMNSSGSYKHYRQNLKNATNPSLPYLPVILSDLTFMEDGNPDKLGNLINFQKRELIHRATSEVQALQQHKYDFPIVEPIHTLLLELPSSSSEELYQLSVMREPRENASGGTLSASGVQSLKKKE
ncbi:hypothetical protein SAMD00019534_055840 [Acytostelium subglobosum LB1]|uniref:hypothetical protein n=1 Tax=Acytostelium subglobosum LB1 TaxID=1410327 RepID=UPI0006451410|nr:hypothetical protein SAMD00019534_055840 [Acytostelium subglobosum LB1]GAM22409.1 hypothetical protein SAMD00019534_055840 [Acytostelium subglobosum LB1]|eukprot:XP_012754529.1 hypothetical protein SAMD00019534_055840 [Acytostelium subglobosum LB1]